MNIMQLLAQSTGLIPQEAPTEDIVVNARQKQAAPPPDDVAPPSLGNAANLIEAQSAAANVPQRKGMFGTKGTLRDILGLVGDAFLVQSGNKQVYAPKRAQERMSDALSGFTQNPLAAIERLANENPDAAAELLQHYQVNQAKMAANQQSAAEASDKNYQNYGRLFSQYMGSASPETYGRLAPLLKTLKTRGGLGDEYEVPDVYDENLARSYQYGGMPANQQIGSEQRDRSLAQGDKKISIAQQNADSNRIRANRAPQPRQAPNPTSASIAAPILQKVQSGQKLSPAEEEVLARTGYSKDRGKGSSRRQPPPLPEGFKIK